MIKMVFKKMIKPSFFFLLVLIYSCTENDVQTVKTDVSLAKYLQDNKQFTTSDVLIACAASQPTTETDYAQFPISVFFLPVTGASDFRYFESDEVSIAIKDYAKFNEKPVTSDPVFNGYLRRFKNSTIKQDVWGIVTYKVGTVIHICRAIRIKHYTKPTQFAPELVTVTNDATFPEFRWTDGVIAENEIYFQVVSNTAGDLISGTYTYEKKFKFYDLTNVVINIRDVNPKPLLAAKTNYNFLLMAISQDNWVNLISIKPFVTE